MLSYAELLRAQAAAAVKYFKTIGMGSLSNPSKLECEIGTPEGRNQIRTVSIDNVETKNHDAIVDGSICHN